MTEHLLRKAKKGDPDAFCRLMDMQTQSMYKIARSYLKNDEDAADAIQDTILSCYENLQSLKNNKYFQTWLTRILINKCKDMLHRKKLTLYTDNVPDTPFYEEDFETSEWNQILSPLDEKYRIVLLLYYMEGFNTTDISQILNMKESTVKTRLQRGRRLLSDAYHYHYHVKEEHA
ncbi:sigma-70 family RNA polymerase sigma factor [Blautia sp.]|uniref:ECF RNA polymerase sigma factor SigW n=1 Tax=Blautia glucerasea TaxID=536633 RepID=A0A6N2TGJ1_9FIRM